MKSNAQPCQRCGRKHVRGWIWLELDSWTNLFHRSGDVPQLPASRSQGLFPFGRDCAAAELRNTARKILARTAAATVVWGSFVEAIRRAFWGA